MTTATNASQTRSAHELGAGADPLEDGRTRCHWAQGHTKAYSFHDAEWGMIPDDEGLMQERVLMACFQRSMPLTDIVAQRHAIWEKLHKWDLAKVGAMDDAAIDALAKEGGIWADRARLVWIRDVAAAAAETGKVCKGLREYFLAARYLAPEELIGDVISRFPGFTRQDAANLCELTGTVSGSAHERDCWRA